MGDEREKRRTRCFNFLIEKNARTNAINVHSVAFTQLSVAMARILHSFVLNDIVVVKKMKQKLHN